MKAIACKLTGWGAVALITLAVNTPAQDAQGNAKPGDAAPEEASGHGTAGSGSTAADTVGSGTGGGGGGGVIGTTRGTGRVAVGGGRGGGLALSDGKGGAVSVIGGGGGGGGYIGFDWLGQTNAWLGVYAEEAPEAVTAQLALEPGTGLLINHVAPESPAAKAGLEKNDVLVRFDDQRLVHPSQLRKLVQVRKEGDEVKLVYYRAGKENTASIKLGKTQGLGAWGELGGPKGDLWELRRQFESGPIRENLEKQMLVLKDSVGHLKLDQEKVREDIRRSMEEARRAVEQALKQSGTAKNEATRAARQALAEIKKAEAQARTESVVVRSAKNNVRTMVKSDDEGTLVLVSQPKPRLTAHDRDGKLLFDGPVATEEEQERVPKSVMERARPMLKDFVAAEAGKVRDAGDSPENSKAEDGEKE